MKNVDDWANELIWDQILLEWAFDPGPRDPYGFVPSYSDTRLALSMLDFPAKRAEDV